MKKLGTKIISCLLALTIFASGNAFALTTSQYDEQISDIKAKQEENEAEAEELNARLDKLKSEVADAEAYQATLEEKIANYQESIDLAIAHIDELNTNIEYLEEEIEKADAEHEATLEKLKVRLCALYTSGGDLTTLQILLDSSSLRDFSMRTEAVQRFTEHDKMLMDEIQAYMDKTAEQRDELSAEKEELAEQKKELESKQAELQVLEEENEQLIKELNIKAAEQEELLAENERQSQEYLSELDGLIEKRNAQAAIEEEERRKQEEAEKAAQQNQSSSACGSPSSSNSSSVLNTGSLSFMWPLPGYGHGNITQYYGGMYSGTPHKGLDVGVPYGTPIYASESGQVLSAEYHWSWGNNVLIWHNGTYSTRYAHCSSLAVSAGDYVKKGQIIGYVGSTGQSSGNHLHFEVYQNGVRVNPLNFV